MKSPNHSEVARSNKGSFSFSNAVLGILCCQQNRSPTLMFFFFQRRVSWLGTSTSHGGIVTRRYGGLALGELPIWGTSQSKTPCFESKRNSLRFDRFDTHHTCHHTCHIWLVSALKLGKSKKKQCGAGTRASHSKSGEVSPRVAESGQPTS